MDNEYRPLKPGERRMMERELSNASPYMILAGYGQLFPLVLFEYKHAVPLWPALAGGALGLALVFRGYGRPAWAGARFAKIPKELSPHERRLERHIRSVRSGRAMIVANVPFFVLLSLYILLSPALPKARWGLFEYFLAAFLGLLHVFCVAFGTRNTLALRALRRG